MKTIKNKVLALILSLSLASIALLGAVSAIGTWNIRESASSSLERLYGQTAEDATKALRAQKQEELKALAENKSSLADTSLTLILNQTRLVAMAAEDIYSNPAQYLDGQADNSLPVDIFDFTCNLSKDLLSKFSLHLRAPRTVMNPSTLVEKDGAVVKADLDPSSLTGTMRRELYLASFLQGVLGGIRNFDNGDGTYSGIGASYFCLDSSGIDVLADTLTTSMVEYDARQSAWYKEASKLKKGEVYWTNPVQDGSGRGISLICAMPVYVDDKLVGVAGSGGLIDNIRELVQSTTIGDSGYAFLINTGTNGKMNVIANANQDKMSELETHKDDLLQADNAELTNVLGAIDQKKSGISQVKLDGNDSYMAYSPMHLTDWAMVTVIGLDDTSIVTPIDKLKITIDVITKQTIKEMNKQIVLVLVIFLSVALLVTAVVILMSFRFSKRLAKPILTLTDGAGRISGGDLDFQIKVDSDDETALLGDAFNHMTHSLKEYIENLSRVTAEKERIGAELDVAKHIQASMLPCIFPAFPQMPELDIYATMTPAKEVGGDFYDFFLVDNDHLAMVMADVSGKGVPAALFMVIAKTLLKNVSQTGLSPKAVLENVNDQLCENNEAELFVTVWLGILEISTGKMICANAGHEYPVLKKRGGDYELIKDKHGFVLAGMEGAKYKEYELVLNPGDKLYLYTDGVAEATDANNELYGTDRMLEALNRNKDTQSTELLLKMKEDIDLFVGAAPQFDDITMLALKFKEEMQ